jgi:hypothetical protein
MFDESAWLRLLFLISDTREWMEEMEKDLFMQLPLAQKKKLFRKSYYLSASSLAHILERHYYKITRHPGAGKFTIPVTDIVHYLREAFHQPSVTMQGTSNSLRQWDTGIIIGTDKYGQPTSVISILTDSAGAVITAFPGLIRQEPAMPIAC